MFAAIGDPDEKPDESVEAVSAAEAAAAEMRTDAEGAAAEMRTGTIVECCCCEHYRL